MTPEDQSAPQELGLRCMIVSPPELEFLVAEIWVGNELIATIDQEDGQEACKIRFEGAGASRISLSDFLVFARATKDFLLDGTKPSPAEAVRASQKSRAKA